jgi:Concanavalin A-like lectin/glucanases superfamily
MTLFSEDFQDGNATGWITSGGTWSVITDGTFAYTQSTLMNSLMVSAATGIWTDQAVEARVKVLQFNGQSTSYLAAVYARFTDVNNHYYLALQSDGNLKVKAKIGGSNSSLGSSLAVNVTTGVWYTIKLEVKGQTLKAYFNGTLMETDTNAALASGGIAVGGVNAAAVFDDIKVTLP